MSGQDSGQDFVRRLAEQARVAADGESLERTVSLARMRTVHYRRWHAGQAAPRGRDDMAIRDLDRRLELEAANHSVCPCRKWKLLQQQEIAVGHGQRRATKAGRPRPFPELAPTTPGAARDVAGRGRARTAHGPGD